MIHDTNYDEVLEFFPTKLYYSINIPLEREPIFSIDR